MFFKVLYILGVHGRVTAFLLFKKKSNSNVNTFFKDEMHLIIAKFYDI